jgi:farnesol dehydrogenase
MAIVDAVCHVAALVSVWRKDPREFDEVNIHGLEHVLAAARDRGLARIVYTSSFLARPPAGRTAPLVANDYQRTKAAALSVARDAASSGAPIVTLFPGVLFGSGIMSEGNLVGRMLADHIAGRLPGLIGADHIWSYAWVDAVADAHVTALERGAAGAEYQLGGDNLPQRRPFELLHEWRGTPLPRRIPTSIASALGLVLEAGARLTGRPSKLTRATVEIFRHDWPLDSARAMTDLDYRPLALADGLARMLPEVLGPPAMGQ